MSCWLLQVITQLVSGAVYLLILDIALRRAERKILDETERFVAELRGPL